MQKHTQKNRRENQTNHKVIRLDSVIIKENKKKKANWKVTLISKKVYAMKLGISSHLI